MKVLLTGATGFIGSHVAHTLVREGNEVHALVRSNSDHSRIRDIESSLHQTPVDILQSPLTVSDEPFPVCIHLAWYVEPGKYLTAPQNLDYLCASLRLTKRLAEIGCHRLVVAGTCFEYLQSTELLSETAPTRPRHLYSACKLALYHALDGFCRTAGMEFAWTRFFYQYGPHEDPRRFVPSVINSLLRGKRFELTPGEQVRDFLHVEDVAAAVCAVAQSKLTGAVNIGSGQPVTVREIAQRIGQVIGRLDLIAFGAQPYAQDEPMHIVADNTKLCTGTDWNPQFTLDTGLCQSIEWWKHRGE